MVFHWSLSDCKSPQVSRTLRILADLNNVVARMVSTGPLISQFSILGTNPLVTVPSAPITIFSVLLQVLGTYLSFHFLSVLPFDHPERQSPLFGRFIFHVFVDYH